MKNFFKKLSFVLAIAMVLTSLAPATASAAAKNYVKVNGKKATATYAFIGGKEVTLTPYVNGKVASKVTIENSNPEKATVSSKGVVTPIDNGNTIVTFKSGKTTIGKVTVKVRTRAKSVNIYDRDEYKASNKTKLTELTLKVGDTKDLQVTMPVYKATKKAYKGAKSAPKASYFTYASSSNEEVATVTKNAGQRNFTVKAVGAGSAKVTIVANQKTEKNVKADKYYVEASFDVTVKDDSIEAKQTGVNKITVKGADLTDKVADYVVKRGTVTLSVKSVTLNDAKTEAVLEASSSTMPKGDYTLSFNKGDEVAFTVEEGVVSKIVVDPESAILDVADATKAYTYFKILNQFDEDVTKTERANCTINGAAPDASDIHKVNFSTGSSQPYTLNLSKVTLSIVYNKNGVNYVGTLDVTGSAKLAETEFKGVFAKNNSTGLYAEKALKVTDDYTKFYLVFAVKDQYGRSAANNVTGGALKSLQVNLSSVTGLTVGTGEAWTDNQLGDYATYVAYPLALVSGGTYAAGEVNVLVVQLTDGKTVNGKFTVAQKQLIDSLTVTVSDVVYGGQKNTLEFTALDQDGNEIKDYNTLSRMNTKFGSNGLAFTFNADGTGKLEYDAPANAYSENAVSVPQVLTWLSETNKFGSVNLSVQPNRVPKAVIGVKSTIALAQTKTGVTTINANDFIYQDQYGNTIQSWELGKVFANTTKNKISVELASALGDSFTGTPTSSAVVATSASTAVTLTRTVTPGSVSLKVSIDDVTASDYTFKVENVALASVSNFEISDISRVQLTSTSEADFDVYGYANGTKVKLKAGQDYDTYADSEVVTSAAIDFSKEGFTVKEKELTVVIANAAGTTLTKKYEYSNAPAVPVKVQANASFAGYVTCTAVGGIDADQVAKSALPTDLDPTAVLNAITQYDTNYGTTPRVTFSGYDAAATPSGNGTTGATLKWSSAVGFTTVNVKYVYDNGTTFETLLVVKVQ